MTTIHHSNILFVNLETVTDVFVWDNQLSACLVGALDNIEVGAIVVALRRGCAVAAGRVTSRVLFGNCGYDDRKKYRPRRIWVRMNLHPERLPVLLSSEQRNTLKVTAKEYGCAYPGFTDVLAIPESEYHHFIELLNRLERDLDMPSTTALDAERSRLQDILSREDTPDEEKVNLCNALCGHGELANAIHNRDEHRSVTDHDLDWVATRIVPWEACSDKERTDPNNYVLLDRQLAEHFAMGMVSFWSTGKQFRDAMDEEAFDAWVDPNFNLPPLNKFQKKYMTYHRDHVFKSWRSGLPMPMYFPDQ